MHPEGTSTRRQAVLEALGEHPVGEDAAGDPNLTRLDGVHEAQGSIDERIVEC